MEFGGEEDDGDAYVVGGELEGAAYFVDGGGAEGVEDFWSVEGDSRAAIAGAYSVGNVGEGLRGGFRVVFVVMDEGVNWYEVEAVAEFGGGGCGGRVAVV